jgi:putative endopeptidase
MPNRFTRATRVALLAALMSATALAAPALGEDAQLQSPKFGAWGFDLSGMDRAARPGDDFYRFANGLWDDRTEIPPDRARYGAFDSLAALSEARVHAILEDAAAGKLSDPDAARIAAAYAAFMDEALVERLDAKPIAPELAELRAVRTKDDFTALMGRANHTGFATFLPLYVIMDFKAPSRHALYATTAGLGLPDRDYYLRPGFAEQKAKYEAYVAQMLGFIGWSDPAGAAKAVVAFETRLAEATWTNVERRDRDKTYNPKSVAELQALMPGFNWKRYLAAAELKGADRVVVTTDTAFPKFAAIYSETPLETLKAWQAFSMIDDAAPYLSKRFVEARFEFRGRQLSGQPEMRARWKRAAAFTNDTIGEAVGRVYVARWFPPEAKAKIDALVANMKAAMRARIERLEWMGPETKAEALVKLSKMGVDIGYPSTWRDYSALTLKRDDLYGNAMRAAAFDWRRDVARLNRPVDRTEWSMPPQTVNAFYNFAYNKIVFPAAILEPPFFHPDADPAINYGGIGGVIGHEISHGFDDQSRKSDADGLLREWWTPQDEARFNAEAMKLATQYSAFEPLPGVKLNGVVGKGENIGDLGGLSLALDAYIASLGGKPAPVLDGLTGEQRVFLGWAQVWRAKQRPESLRQQIAAGRHSPAYYRVNGTIRNVPGWYEAWDVKAGDKLHIAPEDRVRIW